MESDAAFLVVRLAAFLFENLQAVPLRAFGPLLDFLGIDLRARTRVMSLEDVVRVAAGERRVARAKQLLRRGGLGFAFDHRKAALEEILFRSAGAKLSFHH